MNRQSCAAIIAVILIQLQSGCVVVQRVSDFVHCVVEEKHFNQSQRQLELQALRDQRELEREALRSHYADERESLRARHDLDIQASRPDFKDRMKTKLALDLDQKVEIGDLQVDEKKLAEMLQKRNEERESLKRTYDALNEKINAQNREALLKKATEALTRGDNAAAREALASCNQPSPPTCSQPGNEPLTREPLVKPLTPEEIPFMLPITVSVGMGGPRLERSALLREPIVKEPIKKQCCQPGYQPGCQPGCVPLEGCVAGPFITPNQSLPPLEHEPMKPVPDPGADPSKSPPPGPVPENKQSEPASFDSQIPSPISSKASRLNKSFSLRKPASSVSKASHTENGT